MGKQMFSLMEIEIFGKNSQPSSKTEFGIWRVFGLFETLFSPILAGFHQSCDQK